MKKVYKVLTFIALGCSAVFAQTPVVVQQRSVTPPLVSITGGVAGTQAFGLISSDDVLPKTPSFKFGGMADGAGIIINKPAVVSKSISGLKGNLVTISGMHNPEGTYVYLTNHEDNLGISRQFYDHTFKPIAGDWILNSNAGYWRLCSGTMAIPEEHGFGPVFFSGGESGAESLVHAVDPFETVKFKNLSPDDSLLWDNNANYLHSWGRWSTENAVPLHKDAYPGKVAIILGDDDFDAEGQLVLITGELSNFQAKNYNNVKVYALRRSLTFTGLAGADLTKAIYERGMTAGNTYDVEFVEIPSITGMTGAQVNAFCNANNMIRFGRTEDIDYRKSMTNPGKAAKEIYFAVTGQLFADGSNIGSPDLDPVTFPGYWNGTTTGYAKNGYTGFTTSLALPDMYVYSAPGVKTMFGRVYKLVLDDNDMFKGKLSILWDGDVKTSDPADIKNYLMNPDNVVATEDYLYIQEDPNRYSAGGTRTDLKRQFLFNYENHDARIYQYNLITGEVKILLEQDHRRGASTFDRNYYNQSPVGGGSFTNPNPTATTFSLSRPGDWEYGAMVDVSKELGIPGTYILCNQPHSWQSLNYIRPDGGSRPTPQGFRLEASNLILLSGVPEKVGGNGFSTAAETPTWYWYTTSVGGTPVATGKDFVTTVTSDVTYFVSYGTSMRQSALREAVTVKAVEVTSVEGLEGVAAFNVYPNPNNGTFTLEFDSKIAGSVKVEVYDINGKLVFIDVVSTAGLYKKSISVLGKGSYVARISSGSKAATKTIVVE